MPGAGLEADRRCRWWRRDPGNGGLFVKGPLCYRRGMQQAVFNNVEQSWPQWQVAYSSFSEEPFSASSVGKYTLAGLKVQRVIAACERLATAFRYGTSVLERLNLSYPVVPAEFLDPGDSSDIHDHDIAVLDRKIAWLEHLGEKFTKMNTELDVQLTQLSEAARKNRSAKIREVSEEVRLFGNAIRRTLSAYKDLLLVSKGLAARIRHDTDQSTKTIDNLSDLDVLLHDAWAP